MAEDQVVEETKKHINNVAKLLNHVRDKLMLRMQQHDTSKLQSPELEYFLHFTETLKGTTYGSPEYQQLLDGLKPALDHHYAVNRHHPEHYDDGVNGMTLIDVVEMLCDWKAATLRHADGDIMKSIDINTERFGLSPQLAQILKNTVRVLEEVQTLESGK